MAKYFIVIGYKRMTVVGAEWKENLHGTCFDINNSFKLYFYTAKKRPESKENIEGFFKNIGITNTDEIIVFGHGYETAKNPGINNKQMDEVKKTYGKLAYRIFSTAESDEYPCKILSILINSIEEENGELKLNLKKLNDSLANDNLKFDWETLKKEVKKKDLTKLLSIPHLALQAFWGISVKEINNKEIKFIKYGKRKYKFNDKNLKNSFEKQRDSIQDADDGQIDDKLLELFPNPDVFKLPEEAEFDYFAPLFDIFFGNNKKNNKEYNCKEEKEMYKERINLEEIIGNKDDFEFIIKSEGMNFDKFKNCLKELFAMLANTEMCEKNKKKYGYKGEYNAQIQSVLKELNKELNNSIFTQKHCKLEKRTKHSYKNLQKQIIEWGIEKAMTVIGGIEVLTQRYLI